MKNNLVRAIVSAVAIVGVPHFSLAQTLSPLDPCLADPNAPGDDSLTQQLDKCNGVLVPPKIGDGEIVERAPQGGTIRVIPPPKTAGPDDDNRSASDAPDSVAGDLGYDLSEIVDAIALSATTALELETIEGSRIEVRDISILLSGSNAAVLNASLIQHSDDVASLRQAIAKNVMLSSAISDKGLSVEGIVAAKIDDEKSVTFFGR